MIKLLKSCKIKKTTKIDKYFFGVPVGPNEAVIGLGHKRYTLVDLQNLQWLTQYRWHVGGNHKNRNDQGYVCRYEGEKLIYMHREIMGVAADKQIDHINGNTFDNRKCNLRVSTQQQNTQNACKHRLSSSKYKGVSWHKYNRKWRARIGHNKKEIHLGSFTNELDAAMAYDNAARKIFGEFARLNFA